MAGSARTRTRWLPISQDAFARREGRGSSLWGHAPFGPASLPRLRAPARPPSWNWEEEGEGDRDEIGAVVRREVETEKRRGREGTGTVSSALSTVFQLSSREKRGKGGGQGGSEGCHSWTPGERGRAAGRPRGGPPVGGRRPGAQALVSQISGLGPRFSNTQVSTFIFQVSGTRVPTSPNLGLCFIEFNISGVQAPACTSIRGSLPRRSNIGFILSPCKYTGSDPTVRNPGFSNCRLRAGGGLDREVRSGCHPLPSRGGFPGPPLRKGESRGRGGKGKGLLAPLPAWQSRWRTPGGSGGAGAP